MALWGSLWAVSQEAKEIRAEMERRPLLNCPLCGNILSIRGDGTRNCDVGHYTTSQQTDVIGYL